MSAAIAAEDWTRLLDRLVSDRVRIADSVVSALRTRIPSYRRLSLDTLAAEVRTVVELALRYVGKDRGTVATDSSAALEAIGRLHAHQGISVQDLLHARRTVVQLILQRAQDVSSELELNSAAAIELAQTIFAWSDSATVTITRAHDHVVHELVNSELERRSAYVRGVLHGTLSPEETLDGARAYGIDPRAEYVAVRIRCAGPATSTQAQSRLPIEFSAIPGLYTRIGDDIAGFLQCSPASDDSSTVGVGPKRRLERLAESFRLATRAVETASGFGLTGVHDYSALGLRMTVAADEEVGDILTRKYVQLLADSNSGDELIASLRAYFECGMHVETTAERLFVHQNTVRYRISRCEELLNVSLRDLRTVFELWWALERDAFEKRCAKTDLPQPQHPGANSKVRVKS
ncbi:PucR family transcriptional regulator [Skermania sp. ID1734]|nr:PucR family transcriptional regulator [Skermania sp. ID1734]